MKQTETKKKKRVETKLKILTFKDEDLEHEKEVLISGIMPLMRRFPIEYLRKLGHTVLAAYGMDHEFVEGGGA